MVVGINALNQTDRLAISEFCTLIRHKLGENLKQLRLFGSKVRGDDDPESDIDILVLLEKRDTEMDNVIIDLAYDISLKFDVVIIPVVLTAEEYFSSLSKATLFYYNTRNEGVAL